MLCHSSEPAVFVKKLSDHSVEPGKSIILESTYTGTLPISVTWKKDGFNITPSEKCSIVTTEKTCILEILNSTKRDATPLSPGLPGILSIPFTIWKTNFRRKFFSSFHPTPPPLALAGGERLDLRLPFLTAQGRGVESSRLPRGRVWVLCVGRRREAFRTWRWKN